MTDLYASWLYDLQQFQDDTEKATLIAEVVLRYIRARRLLDAAELFVQFGWLCALFAQVARIQRVFEEVVREDQRKEEDIQHEVGRLLLQHHIGVDTGNEMTLVERDQIYLQIHHKVLLGEVTLQAHAELTVLFHTLLVYINKSLFVEASRLLDETYARLERTGQLSPEVYASFLGNKARLFARWWDKTREPQELSHLQEQCLAALQESITQWRLCLRYALPMQSAYYHFKLARVLNDYAYRQRLTSYLVEAKAAIEECLRLKKSGGALPRSLSISLSEYSQILAALGKLRQARAYNEEACSLMEDLVQKGKTSLHSELGMLLIERATIVRQQACLEEARALLERGIALIADTASASRLRIRSEAKEKLEEIRLILETKQHYQFDSRWFSRYQKLAAYNDIAWLECTGPFNDKEQREWEELWPHREKPDVDKRMAALMVQARQREFACAQEERRAPELCYPRIPSRFCQATHRPIRGSPERGRVPGNTRSRSYPLYRGHR